MANGRLSVLGAGEPEPEELPLPEEEEDAAVRFDETGVDPALQPDAAGLLVDGLGVEREPLELLEADRV